MPTALNQEQITQRLENYAGWQLEEDGHLRKTFTLQNFNRAILFAAAVGHFAEAANHHPDLLIHGYKNLTISLMSHEAKGITENDFALIEKIEGLLP